MQNLRIGFSHGKGWVSRLISWGTRSPVSHCFVLVNIDGQEIVMGADPNGFVAQTYKRFQAENEVIQVFGEAELGQSLDAGAGFILECLDEGYDYAGFFGMMIVTLFGWFGMKIRNPWGSPYRLFCSEALAQMLQKIGYPKAETLDTRSCSPKDLWEFLKTR